MWKEESLIGVVEKNCQCDVKPSPRRGKNMNEEKEVKLKVVINIEYTPSILVTRKKSHTLRSPTFSVDAGRAMFYMSLLCSLFEGTAAAFQ